MRTTASASLASCRHFLGCLRELHSTSEFLPFSTSARHADFFEQRSNSSAAPQRLFRRSRRYLLLAAQTLASLGYFTGASFALQPGADALHRSAAVARELSGTAHVDGGTALLSSQGAFVLHAKTCTVIVPLRPSGDGFRGHFRRELTDSPVNWRDRRPTQSDSRQTRSWCLKPSCSVPPTTIVHRTRSFPACCRAPELLNRRLAQCRMLSCPLRDQMSLVFKNRDSIREAVSVVESDRQPQL